MGSPVILRSALYDGLTGALPFLGFFRGFLGGSGSFPARRRLARTGALGFRALGFAFPFGFAFAFTQRHRANCLPALEQCAPFFAALGIPYTIQHNKIYQTIDLDADLFQLLLYRLLLTLYRLLLPPLLPLLLPDVCIQAHVLLHLRKRNHRFANAAGWRMRGYTMRGSLGFQSFWKERGMMTFL